MSDRQKPPKSTLKSGPRINFRKIPVDIICEWDGCIFSSTNIKELQEHVLGHLRSMYNNITLSTTAPTEMMCHICHDSLPADFSCIRHAYYHVYHFNLKSRGRHIKEVYNLSDCNLDKGSSNVVPPLTHPFICQWRGCNYSNDSITDFYDHVDDHPFYEGDPENQLVFQCKWSDCRYTTVTAHRLLIHMSIHCEKRYIACPNCGMCFATSSKFMDHLRRQIVSVWNKEMQEKEMKTVLSTLANTYNPVIPLPKPVIEAPPEAFKCNLCMHLFATKQMLKNHETRHISTLVCPHCNISSSSRYALKRHILFRHTEEKPFKCDECDLSFKCNDVLRRHVQALHYNENSNLELKCDAVNCNFLAKNKHALNIHKSRMHCKIQTIVTKVYVCHKCEQEYVKGSFLTAHLSKDHGIKKTSNRYRHQYKICEDGKYRLNMFDLKLKSVVKERSHNHSNHLLHQHRHHQNSIVKTEVTNDNENYSNCKLSNIKKEKPSLFEHHDYFSNNNNHHHNSEIQGSDIVDEILEVHDLDYSYC